MSPAPREHTVVAIYHSHAGAEAAIKTLQQAGLETKQLSIVGKGLHTEEHALGFCTSGDRMKFWAGRGAFRGSLWGMLFGNALFLLPAIGPVVVMGPLVAWIASALEDAAVGGAAGALTAALAGTGLRKDSVMKYELEVKAGRSLVLVHGSAGLIDQARNLLGTTDVTHVTAHVNRSGALDRAQMLIPARSESTWEGEWAAHVTRESILAELSNDQVALASFAETAAHLSDGEEYLDLEQLNQGVRRTLGAITAIGRVFPGRPFTRVPGARS